MPLAGEIIDAGDVPGSSWTSYTPTITAAGGSPTAGNGTWTAKYYQVGKIVHVQASLTWGTTTSFGTGTVQWSLPVTASAIVPSHVGTAFLIDASVGRLIGSVELQTTTTFIIVSAFRSAMTNPGDIVTGALPFTWVTTDELRFELSYEAA